MVFKSVAPVLLLIVGALGAEITPPSPLLVDADVPDDKVTLLQSQVEVKKGEAKAAQQIQPDDDDDDKTELAYAKASCSSSGSCDSVETPATFKLTIPAIQSHDAESQQKPPQAPETKKEASTQADEASKIPLGTVLQALAILIIADVLRRCPWKAKSGSKTKKNTTKAAANTDPSAALLTAALDGDAAAFDAQIAKNMSQLSRVDAWGCSLLHYAAKGGSASIVQKLVDLGAFVDALDAWDETPLHLAARAGHVEACEILSVAGASADSTNAEECTPLVVAGRADHEAVCRLLLERGAGVAGLANDKVPELVLALLKEQEEASAAGLA